MKFGSVCSGIEAASVAWHPLGWEAAWLSEIEPFPCALLAHHYPSVPNLGNMTSLPDRIRSGEVEAPDLFCGGTPCQAFSVAGLRHSLDDARGNLSLTFCEIADAIDSVRTIPSVVFWENVPGVLNTKDNAFGCFLGALAGEDDALIPPGGRWANAGFVDGAKRAVAWRILDAQYFGVAQRRRRVFVVASARDDFDPAAVLFEFDGVRRDTAPSREKRQEVAGTITRCAFSGGAGGRPEGAAGNHFVAQTWPAEIATTLDAHFGDKQGLEDQHINGGVPCLSLCLTSGTGKRYDAETETLIPTNGGHFVDAIAFHHNAQVCQLPSPDRDTSISDSLTCSQQAAVAAPSLTASNDPSRSPQSSEVTQQVAACYAAAMQVRRLTPRECERLPGFPDDYTDIKPKGKPTPDGPRYKALGNSWAVPVVRWIGKRIANELA
jgi:DNA (cytosine-5)-methyltransferase 1